jgi:hypothetical protein
MFLYNISQNFFFYHCQNAFIWIKQDPIFMASLEDMSKVGEVIAFSLQERYDIIQIDNTGIIDQAME